MYRAMVGFWLVVISGLSVNPARAADEESLWQGPTAVLAILSGSEAEQLARQAKALQKALEATGKVELLPVNRLVASLGRADRAGPVTEDLERLRGVFQQGYLQSYSFEYKSAIASLNQVLEGLERLPTSPGRWDLYLRACIYAGVSHAGLKEDEKTNQAFWKVLRTRPDMRLDKKDYSPKIIALWEKARADLEGLPTGELAVEGEPAGAEVLLDGARQGEIPFKARLPLGRYHLEVSAPKAGRISRWVTVGASPTLELVRLQFEGALKLDLDHPALVLPAGQEELSREWCSWLSVRLGLHRLVIIRHRPDGGQMRLVAGVVDLDLGQMVRGAWVTPTKSSEDDAVALAEFLATGRTSKPEVQRLPVPVARTAVAAKQAKTGGTGALNPPPPGTRSSAEVTASQPAGDVERPLLRRFWPYATCGAVFLAGGIAMQLVSSDLKSSSGSAADRSQADGFLGAAIGSYVLAGASTVVGIILYTTYHPATPVAIVPSASPRFVGLEWIGRF